MPYKNPEDKKAHSKTWREANKDRVTAANKAWREANREKAAAGTAAWYEANKEKIAAARRARDKADKDRIVAVNRAWREANKEKVAAANRARYEADRGKAVAYVAQRRARKLQATPAWANEAAIRELYAEAAFLTAVIGEPYHVDHIVPLQSKLVCGLHWEANLRVIQGDENCSKSNRHWPDMP